MEGLNSTLTSAYPTETERNSSGYGAIAQLWSVAQWMGMSVAVAYAFGTPLGVITSGVIAAVNIGRYAYGRSADSAKNVEMKQAKDLMQRQINKVCQDNKQLANQLKSVQSEKEQIDAASQLQIIELQTRLSEAETKLDTVEKQYRDKNQLLIQEKSNHQLDRKKLNEQVDSLTAQIKEITSKNEELNNKLFNVERVVELDSSRQLQKFAQTRQEHQHLTDKLQDSKEKNIELTKEVEKLRSDSENLKKFMGKFDDVTAKLKASGTKNRKLEQSIANAKIKMETMQEQYQKDCKELAELNDKERKEQGEIEANMTDKIKQSEQQKAELESQLKEIQAEIKFIKTEGAGEIEKLCQEFESTVEELTEAQSEKQQLAQDLRKAHAKIKELHGQLQTYLTRQDVISLENSLSLIEESTSGYDLQSAHSLATQNFEIMTDVLMSGILEMMEAHNSSQNKMQRTFAEAGKVGFSECMKSIRNFREQAGLYKIAFDVNDSLKESGN